MSNKSLGIIIIVAMLAATLVAGIYAWTNAPSPSPAMNSERDSSAKTTSLDASKSFSLVVLPDTQKYSNLYPDIFCNQTNWILDNKSKLNIAFVSQLGDIVDNGAKFTKEWVIASSCLGILDGVVPYGIIPGNHDNERPGKKSTGFASYDKYFPVSRYSDFPWHGGSFENYHNNYQIIATNGMKLLFINLEIEPSDKAIEWAQSVVTEHSDAYGIVTTHKFLPDVGKARDSQREFSTDGNTGEDIWQKLILKNCSIRLVLNGHYNSNGGENRIVSKNSCGDKVDQIAQDYQGREMGGNGRLRIYTFTPSKKEISVRTYSPYTDSYERDSDSEFTLSIEE